VDGYAGCGAILRDFGAWNSLLHSARRRQGVGGDWREREGGDGLERGWRRWRRGSVVRVFGSGPFHGGVLRFGSGLRLGYPLGCVYFVANLFYPSFVPFQSPISPRRYLVLAASFPLVDIVDDTELTYTPARRQLRHTRHRRAHHSRWLCAQARAPGHVR
jgi:hypothetical protein